MANRPNVFRPGTSTASRLPEKRPKWRKLYTYRWSQYSKRFLSQHPLCVRCPDPTPATEVDHIIPHKGDISLFWDSNNHQALCSTCHKRKTANEDGGFGRGATSS